MLYQISVTVPDLMVESLKRHYGYEETKWVDDGEGVGTYVEVPNPETPSAFVGRKVIEKLTEDAKESDKNAATAAAHAQIIAAYAAVQIDLTITPVE